jgi:hypothetical protein
VRDGEGRPALYLEYSFSVSGSERRGLRPALYLEYCLAVSGRREMARADQPCTWNIVFQYLAVREGEVRPALYLEYCLAVSGGEGPQVGEEYPGEEHGYCVDLLHQFCLRCHRTEGG